MTVQDVLASDQGYQSEFFFSNFRGLDKMIQSTCHYDYMYLH